MLSFNISIGVSDFHMLLGCVGIITYFVPSAHTQNTSHYPHLPPGMITISEALSHHTDPHPLTYIKPLTGIVLFLVGRYSVFQHEEIVTAGEQRTEGR